MDYERPVVRCLVSYPISDDCADPWTAPACVSLELAAELSAKGYAVLVDYQDRHDLAMWERFQRAAVQHPPSRKWFERRD